jgi:hypothetical protein
MVRETRADMARLKERKAEFKRTITKSRARLSDTQAILKGIDAALVRFNALFLRKMSLALFGVSSGMLI